MFLLFVELLLLSFTSVNIYYQRRYEIYRTQNSRLQLVAVAIVVVAIVSVTIGAVAKVAFAIVVCNHSGPVTNQ